MLGSARKPIVALLEEQRVTPEAISMAICMWILMSLILPRSHGSTSIPPARRVGSFLPGTLFVDNVLLA